MKGDPRKDALKGWMQEQHLVQKKVNAYARKFQGAKPIPHIQIKDFLHEKQIGFLLNAVAKQDFEEKESDLFHFHQTKDLSRSTSFVLSGFHTMLSSSYFLKYIQEITGLPKLKNHVDLHGLSFPKHGYLLPHDDRMDARKLAYILYLSPSLTKRDGGTLELFDFNKDNQPTKVVKSYPPVQNSFFLFQVSRQSFHQVTEVLNDKERITLGGWFHG